MMWHLWITRVICKYSIYWIVLVLVLFAEGLLLVIPLKHIALLEALLRKWQGSLLQITTKLNIGCLKWIPLICRFITCWKLIQRLLFSPTATASEKILLLSIWLTDDVVIQEENVPVCITKAWKCPRHLSKLEVYNDILWQQVSRHSV